MSRDEMSALQGKRLNKLVNLVYHNVPFYRNKMQEMDLSPDDIQTIEDIVKLPFTTFIASIASISAFDGSDSTKRILVMQCVTA